MSAPRRWDPAIRHSGTSAHAFLARHFASKECRCLFVAGAGFDPRTGIVAAIIGSAAAARTTALLVREQRPMPDPALVQAADRNTAILTAALPSSTVIPIDVFARDGAVVGGRSAIQSLRNIDLASFTDVLVDVSALSVGVFFPIVKYLDEAIDQGSLRTNLHVTVADNPTLDDAVGANSGDAVVAPHGFQGSLQLDANATAVRLWIPHLALAKRPVLERIFRWLNPDDVCPILPFPSANPRRPEELLDYFRDELESVWDVHARNIVYADESNPLDVYRMILRIDGTRRRVFEQVGGSLLVLSPVGAKSLALGAMLAAMERDFPVRYVESVEYLVNSSVFTADYLATTRLHHLWLRGVAYPSRAPLSTPLALA